jgi:hypothetical protein
MHEFLFVNSWLFYGLRFCNILSFLVLSYAPPLGGWGVICACLRKRPIQSIQLKASSETSIVLHLVTVPLKRGRVGAKASKKIWPAQN